MNQPHVEHEERAAAEASGPQPGAAPGTGLRAVAGPFGLRDIVVGSAVLVMLVGSVLPFTVGSGRNLWTAFSLFYVGIGIIMPLVVAGLFAARRLAPATRLRIGSLSLDQFASVIAVLAAIFFFLQIVYVFSVGSLLGLIGAAALLAATTFAPHIPPFAAEFSGRTEIPAHPVARDSKPLVRVPKPAPAPRPETAGAPAGSQVPGMFGRDQAARNAAGTDAGQGGAPREAAPHGGTAQAAAAQGSAGQASGRTDGAAGAQTGTQSGTQTGTQSGAGQASTAPAPGPDAGSRPAAAGAAAGAAAAGAAGAGTAAPSGAASAAEEKGSAGPARTAPGTSVPAGEDPLPATTVNPAVQGGAGSQAPVHESISATREENENVVEAFWFAVGTPRQIVDERTGLPLFMFYPGDWELGLEDRGHEFLVQDKRTGRIGVLRDLTNIERVSDDSSGH